MTSDLPADLTPGVSVLVRTFGGVDRISDTLDSLRDQTLDTSKYEVVVVPNGPDDGTAQLLRGYQRQHPAFDLRVVRSPVKGIGASMNIGLAAARREYMTVVDDDDRVSAEYLAALMRRADPEVIAHGYLANVQADGTGEPDFDTYVNRSLSAAVRKIVHPSVAPSTLMFNVAKLVWTPYARAVRARENLRFATDVVYWHELVNAFALRIRPVPSRSHAVYYRSLRTGSHSRPADQSWELAIEARLDAIEALMPIALDPSQHVHLVARKSIESQARAMGLYLQEHPDEHSKVLAVIAGRGIDSSVIRPLNRSRARDLVTCFCFLPSNNTSALVAARRIRERGLCVDVVSHNMTGIHGRDDAAMAIVKPYLGNRKTVRGNPRFSNWASIRHFCAEGIKAIERWEESRGAYRSVYSRAMWPASHVLAALHKLHSPDVRWIAEFSDPLSHNVENKPRSGRRGNDDLSAELDAGLAASGHPAPTDATLLPWIEHLAFALADEIVFTNEHQQRTMLDHIADDGLRERVRERSVISAHPTLPPEFYQMAPVDYPLEQGRTHVAYFGAFYATRGLTEVTDAIKALDSATRRRLKLHVFTKDPEQLAAELAAAGLADTVVANPYVPYLEFLNLTTLFDCLLVNDARTADTHPVNPYLPSKVSDYRGSGRPIWAIIEPGSILSGMETEFRSELGDVEGAVRVLSELTARVGAEPQPAA